MNTRSLLPEQRCFRCGTVALPLGHVRFAGPDTPIVEFTYLCVNSIVVVKDLVRRDAAPPKTVDLIHCHLFDGFDGV